MRTWDCGRWCTSGTECASRTGNGRLEPLPTERGPALGADDWTKHLGQCDAINGYRALVARAIARHGRDATLRTHLPALLPGIGSEAFHALG